MHETDLLDDYIFFGQTFRWQPSEIDNMTWSYRKSIKQAYKDNMVNNKKA